MSNIEIFESQIIDYGYTPVEVRLRNGCVRWFVAYDSASYFLIIYDGLGKAYAADFIMRAEELPIYGIVRCHDDSIVTTVGVSTVKLVRYMKIDLVV